MGHAKIITAILIWSSLGIFIRRIDLTNVEIVFYTSLIAGIIQLFFLISTGLIKEPLRRGPGIKNLLFLGIVPFSFIANTILFYYAFRNTTIANAVLAHYTAPVFVALMAPLILQEKIRSNAWIAILLSSAGLWFILGTANPGKGLSIEGAATLGIIAGVLSGFAYAVLIIVIRRIASLYSSLFITCVQNVIVVFLLFSFMPELNISSGSLPYVLILGVFHSTIAPLLYVQGFRTVRANEAAILGYLEPVGAIILAFVFLKESPGISALIGGALILCSGYLILRKREG